MRMASWANLLLALCATTAWATGSIPVNRQPNGLNWSPDGTATGDHKFVTLYSSVQDGVNGLWCSDCACNGDGTCAQGTGGVDGAFAYRERGKWDCICVGPGGPGCFQCSDLGACNLCPTVLSCLPPCVALGQGCSNSGDCCSGFCVDGICSMPSCVADGGGCTVNADCCSDSCVMGVCGTTTTTTSTSTTTTLLGTEPFTLDPGLIDDDHYEFFACNYAAGCTLLDVACYCEGGCTSEFVIGFETRAGAGIDVTGGNAPNLQCTTGSSSSTYTTFNTGDSDRILVLGQGVKLNVVTAPTTVDRLHWYLRYTVP